MYLVAGPFMSAPSCKHAQCTCSMLKQLPLDGQYYNSSCMHPLHSNTVPCTVTLCMWLSSSTCDCLLGKWSTNFQYLLYQLITSGLKRACDPLTFALAFYTSTKKEKGGDFKFRLEQVGGACAIIIKDYVVHTVPHMAVHIYIISDMVLLFFQTRPDCASLSRAHACHVACACMWLLIITCNIACACVFTSERHTVWSGLLVSYAHVSGMHVSIACECAVICMLFPAQTLCGNSQPWKFSNWVTLGYFLKC